MTLGELMAALSGKRPEPQVRTSPDGGLNLREILAGSQVQPSMKSPYERTMRPGETRSAGDVQDMLAEVILATGGAVVPGVGPQGQARQSPARVRPGYEKQFNKWFSGSKLVNEKGEPLTVYHGTTRNFESFDPKTIGSNTRIGISGKGFYFSPDPTSPNLYGELPGGRVVPAHVRLRNPKIIGPDQMIRDYKGHDGVIRLGDNGEILEVVAKSPSQIKSAIGNSGEYGKTGNFSR